MHVHANITSYGVDVVLSFTKRHHYLQVHRTPGYWSRVDPHLLPSPESSPDTAYIGQHSQGIGGHYLDSYILKR